MAILNAISKYEKAVRNFCRYRKIEYVEEIIETLNDSVRDMDLDKELTDYSKLKELLGEPYEFVEYYAAMYTDQDPSILPTRQTSELVKIWVDRVLKEPIFLRSNQLLFLTLLLIPVLLEILDLLEIIVGIMHYPVIDPNPVFLVTIIIYELATALTGYYPLSQKNHLFYMTINRAVLAFGLIVTTLQAELVIFPLENAIHQYLSAIVIYETILLIKQIIPALMNFRANQRRIIVKDTTFLAMYWVWDTFLIETVGTPQQHTQSYLLIWVLLGAYVLSSAIEYMNLEEDNHLYRTNYGNLRELARSIQHSIADYLYPKKLRMAYPFFAVACFYLLNLLRPETISSEGWTVTYIFRMLEFLVPGLIVLLAEQGRWIAERIERSSVLAHVMIRMYTYSPIVFVTQLLLVIFSPVRYIFYEEPQSLTLYLIIMSILVLVLVSLANAYFFLDNNIEQVGRDMITAIVLLLSVIIPIVVWVISYNYFNNFFYVMIYEDRDRKVLTDFYSLFIGIAAYIIIQISTIVNHILNKKSIEDNVMSEE